MKGILSCGLLIAQVELRDEKAARAAALEFLVKTMNVDVDGRLWQVDAGPVLLPDLRTSPQERASSLRLAIIAFGALDWADFVIDELTAIAEVDGQPVRVHHYSAMPHLATRNVLLAPLT